MSLSLVTVRIANEHDVVLTRQRARQAAAALGFDAQDQVRIATAVSEVARNAFRYAGGGRAEFTLNDREPALVVRVVDGGKGIDDLPAVLAGRVRPDAGTGLGLVGARRLVDAFDIETSPGGTTVTLSKRLPDGIRLDAKAVAKVGDGLARQAALDPYAELAAQNRALVDALERSREQAEALEQKNAEIEQLNRELEDTNRGVVALYAELDEKAESLQRANVLKTKFLSNMTHEFRTPLTSILSLSRLLLDRFDGPLTEEQETQVRLIAKATTDLSDLVEDLLDLAKVEAGKIVVRPGTMDVAGVLGALRAVMRPVAQSNPEVELLVEEPPTLPPIVTDEKRVSQILRNFVSNGLKYSERGVVRVTAERVGDELVFAVKDAGIGIAPEDQDRIFEEFGQLETPLHRNVRGTGLGLPLSRRLAQLLGGRITLESRHGEGSTFRLHLPFTPPAPDPES